MLSKKATVAINVNEELLPLTVGSHVCYSFYLIQFTYAFLSEWFKELVLKTSSRKRLVGSNPTEGAIGRKTIKPLEKIRTIPPK